MDLDAEVRARVRTGLVRVPPYPAAALKLSALILREDFGQSELLSIVKMDPVLASVLLRLANSASYKRGADVTDLATAVQRVGAKQVQTVAMASGLQAAAKRPGPLASLRRRVWIEALTNARVAELLATLEGESAGASFLAGLLHDIGQNLAIACLEDIITSALAPEARTEEVWWSVIERFHVELGLVLAEKWQLSDSLTRVIAEHHYESPSDPLITRIALSDHLVGVLMARPGMTPEELRQMLGISMPEADRLGEGICALPEFIRAFEAEATVPAAEVPSMIRPSPRPLPQPTQTGRLGQPVSIAGASAATALGTLWAATASELVVKVGQPLRTNVLVQVRFPGFCAESFCGKTRVCMSLDDSHLVTLGAFSLSPGQLKSWNAVVLCDGPPIEAAENPPPPEPAPEG